MGGQKEQGGARQGFDVADAAPLLLDPHGLVAGWTVHAERLLGHGAAEAVGRKFADLLEAEDAERMEDLLARCRTGGDWTGLMTALHRDGQPVPVSVRVAPTTAPQGRPAVLVLLSELDGGARGWDMSRGVLEQIVAGNPIGIAIVDTELRYVWSNAALERWGGGPGRSRVGLRVADVQPGMDSEAVEERMRHVLETGEQVIDYEYVGRVRSAPLRETAHMLSFTRLEDDRGDPMGVYYTVVDVTDRHRARERLALLDRAGQYIGRTLDVMTTAQELADVAVPGLADFVTVDLLETVLRGAEPVPEPLAGSERMPLRRAGHRSLYEDLPRTTVHSGAVVSYLAGSPPVRCLATGRSWRQEQLDPLAVEWAADAPDGRESTFLELGLQSVMIVPIRARGVTLGLTTFFRRRQSPFDADDLHLAEDLVSRAAVCVDNARRYTRERDAALVLQRSLLPRRLPDQDAVEVAACYRPADELTGLGGDWYDLIPLSGARVALVVGEVPGHGIDAAAAMGRLRTAVRTLAAIDLPPEEVLAHLDDLAFRSARDDDGDGDGGDDGSEGGDGGSEGGDAQGNSVGSGCLYVVYDPADGRCTMAAAGHPAPAVVAPDGTVGFVDLPQGPALGVGGPPFEAVELSLDEGSTLVLHTDGLLAHGDGRAEEAGRERLRRALEGTERELRPSCQAVVDALVPARPEDDVALLMARTRLLAPEQIAAWDLPSDPAVVADARRTAQDQLSRWGLDAELKFTTELLVSELVTNAIRHASGRVRLRLIRERTLVCEVLDGGASAPHLRHPRAMDEGGRGLLLVSQLAERWGTRFVPDGKIIWAEQPLTTSPE
ncbi:protein phosphatase [Streptomyces sp. BSE7F]|uniref:SpoIIE family protein phosphatase n=1 Tax=Streptomyces sp. BSE7-9 TaxID=2759948 RepID=UPI000D60BC6D|nr:SpoIIE family protein phosphatase [Streptomyces sp. BSE7-9]MBJ6647414.1 SpoIIE family protein phosphatase [Streptomyces sp. BSE7-9]PWE11667.1 protein phosphatase [Streptomyces sp. BSE7F]